MTTSTIASAECTTFTIRSLSALDLEVLGVGAAGKVYKIDEHTVLKALRAYEPPTCDSLPRDHWFYVSETLFAFSLMKDERTVYRLLEKWPHPNIAEAIDIDHGEGIYLRKYHPLSQFGSPTQSVRVQWYRDIIRGLLHLHNLHVAHADVRIDNVLFDSHGRAILCDFSASCPFGYPNLVRSCPNVPMPINGPMEIVSDATDRFAMASLMFHMETGNKAELVIEDDGTLILPPIRTGHNSMDSMIRRAWLAEYSSTAEMLEHAESLHIDECRESQGSMTEQVPKNVLQVRIRNWRKHRKEQLGWVTHSLPTEAQLQSLAAQHGLEVDGEVRFNGEYPQQKCTTAANTSVHIVPIPMSDLEGLR